MRLSIDESSALGVERGCFPPRDFALRLSESELLGGRLGATGPVIRSSRVPP
jgi:hypothetical protein